MAKRRKKAKGLKEQPTTLFSGGDFPDRQVTPCPKCKRTYWLETADSSLVCMSCDRDKAASIHRRSVAGITKADRLKKACQDADQPIMGDVK